MPFEKNAIEWQLCNCCVKHSQTFAEHITKQSEAYTSLGSFNFQVDIELKLCIETNPHQQKSSMR